MLLLKNCLSFLCFHTDCLLQSSVLKVRSEDVGSSGHAKHHSYKQLAHRHPLTQHSRWTHLQIEVGESVNNSEGIYGVKLVSSTQDHGLSLHPEIRNMDKENRDMGKSGKEERVDSGKD